MREISAELCAGFAAAERECFGQWCALLDGRAEPRPDDVAASQAALHAATARLRDWCLADPQAAEAERRELLVRQAEGELAAEAAARARRSGEDRERIRRDWVNARWAIIGQRDALTCGLGWPHRGERVLASTWCPGPGGTREQVAGEGLYLHASDVFNVGHAVWLPSRGGRRRGGTVTARWLPSGGDGAGQLGPADPAGDIGLRLLDAPGRRLPAPLMRWPGPADVGLDVPPPRVPAAQPALFSASEVPAPPAGWLPRPRRGRLLGRAAPAGPGEDDATLF